MKENKKRIIFWFIVMVICFSLSLFGRKSFNEGYGKYGTVKKILDPIAVEFNTNDMVVRYDDLRAEVKKDKLVVSYMAYVNGKKKKINYVFDYVNNNGVEYITNTDENDRWLIQFII